VPSLDVVWSKNSNGLKWRDLGFCTDSLFEWASPIQKQRLQSRFHEVIDYRGIQDALGACSSVVNQELLLRNEYLAAENRILKGQIEGRLVRSE
jgi:hypothetical protein